MKSPLISLFLSCVCALLFVTNASAQVDLLVTSDQTLTTGTFVYDEVIVSNNANLILDGDVHIEARIVTINAGSTINGDGKGYAALQGPGAGSYTTNGGSGAGYGGDGGAQANLVLAPAGKYYGSATVPSEMGSGGGGVQCTILGQSVNSGGSGGGAISFDISETLTVNGTLSVDGLVGSEYECNVNSGGGSGGSIDIIAQTVAGSGVISAKGGDGSMKSTRGGGGGGGRIAIYYEAFTFSGTVSAAGGDAKIELTDGAGSDGTIGLFDTDDNNFTSGHAWRFQVDDGPFLFDTITLDNGATVQSEGTLSITGTNLMIAGGSKLYLTGAETLSIDEVDVQGNSSIIGNTIIKANNLTVAAGSQISADEAGYEGAKGVGAGLQNVGTGGGGGGYGGEGGTTYGGITYGSATAPVDLGSGGFGLLTTVYNEAIPTGGYGGGRIQLNISDTLTVNGTLSANGGNPHSSGTQNGGGSGGSIYILTESFTGSGAITANGGQSGPAAGSLAGGGGGGGRIAIFHRQAETHTGITTATGGIGVGDNGDDGTVILSQSELAVSPDTGGDSGEVTILASGSVFQEGAAFKLTKSGQSDIIGEQIKVLNDGLVLSAVFDLTDAANGSWDVVVIAPDSGTKEISDGFTIEEGDEGGLWVDIIGRDLIRPNREQKFHIAYGNSSNVDADSADIFLEIPTGVEYKFDEDTSFKTASDTTFVHIIDTYVPSGSRKLVPVRVKKNAAAGTNFSLGVAISTHDQSVDADTDHFSKLSTDVTKGILVQQQQQQQSSSSSSGPYADPIKFPGELDNSLATGFVVVTVMSDERISSGKQFKEVGFVDGDVVKFNYPYRDPDSNKRNDIVEFTVAELKAGIVEIGNADVFVDLRFAVRPDTEENMENIIAEQMSDRLAQFNYIDDFNDPNDQGIRFCNPPTECDKNKFELSCKGTIEHLLYAQPIVVPPDNIRYVFDLSMLPYNQANKNEPSQDIEDMVKHWLKISDATYVYIILDEILEAETDFTDWYATHKKLKDINVTNSLDPNDKFGYLGIGAEGYIKADQQLVYTIYFENIDTATAPAQEVVITDQLDTTSLNLASFALGPIGFGDYVITPPDGVSEYITELDLRPDNDIIVRLEAGLNATTGVVTWKFTSLDPETRMFTEDPLAGFLPPNDTPPEGDGFLLYSIVPKSTVSTGDEIDNSASIVFDTNNPIVTPTWTNTIDRTKPQSSVDTMSGTQTTTTFDISWTGSDAHSGIQDYVLYVSENSGPYTAELTTTGTMTSFIGVNGNTYSFYTRAIDKVGNFEDAPSTPDVTVTISDPMQEPCTIYDDYLVGVSCFSSETVTNDTELDDYLFDFGYNGSKYKDLIIDYDVDRDDMDIHSPCEIKVKTTRTLTGQRICIDGREGVSSETYLTVNGTFVTFISELGDVDVGSNSHITATELTLQAYETAEISVTGSVTVDDDLMIKSTGNTLSSKAKMGQNSIISAGSVRLESIREASTGPDMTLTVEGALELISTGTESTSKAVIGISSDISAASLEMSADRNVQIGASTDVSISGAASMTSSGTNLTSDVEIGNAATITADSLNMTGGDEAKLLPYVEVTTTNNFNMDADTPGDCYIDGTATISADSESGNCL